MVTILILDFRGIQTLIVKVYGEYEDHLTTTTTTNTAFIVLEPTNFYLLGRLFPVSDPQIMCKYCFKGILRAVFLSKDGIFGLTNQ